MGKTMSHEERNTCASILSNLLVNSYVLWKYLDLRGAGLLDGPDSFVIWGKMIVWVIPAAVVLNIALYILVNIIAAVRSGEGEGAFLTDERDRMILDRGNVVTLSVAAMGFILSMIFLAIGWNPVTAFVTIYFSYALGDLVGSLHKFATYRAWI